MNLPKTKTKQLKDFFKGLPKALAEEAFLTYLGLLVLGLIFSGIIFYKYGILVKKIEPKITERPLQFDEKTFQEVLKILTQKEKEFQQADFKEYQNPFGEI